MELAILPDLPNAPQVLVTIENARKRGILTTRFIQRDLTTRGIFTSKADLARKSARYVKVHNRLDFELQASRRFDALVANGWKGTHLRSLGHNLGRAVAPVEFAQARRPTGH